MAGSLVQVATNTVSGAVSAVALTGINTDDLYMVSFNDVVGATNNVGIQLQLTKSGSAQSDSNYDYSYKLFRTDTSYTNSSAENQTAVSLSNTGTSTSESGNGIIYLYNFNSSSSYSYFSFQSAFFNASPFLTGAKGQIMHTVASASDGISFKASSGNIASGTFTLYKVI